MKRSTKYLSVALVVTMLLSIVGLSSVFAADSLAFMAPMAISDAYACQISGVDRGQPGIENAYMDITFSGGAAVFQQTEASENNFPIAMYHPDAPVVIDPETDVLYYDFDVTGEYNINIQFSDNYNTVSEISSIGLAAIIDKSLTATDGKAGTYTGSLTMKEIIDFAKSKVTGFDTKGNKVARIDIYSVGGVDKKITVRKLGIGASDGNFKVALDLNSGENWVVQCKPDTSVKIVGYTQIEKPEVTLRVNDGVLSFTRSANSKNFWGSLLLQVNKRINLKETPYLHFDFEIVGGGANNEAWNLRFLVSDGTDKGTTTSMYIGNEIHKAMGGKGVTTWWDDLKTTTTYKGVLDVRDLLMAAAKANEQNKEPLADGVYVQNQYIDLTAISFAIVGGSVGSESPNSFVIREFYLSDSKDAYVAPSEEPSEDPTETPPVDEDPVSGWAAEAVERAWELGILDEEIDDNTTFKVAIPRLYFCKMAVNFIEVVTGMDIDAFIDQYEGDLVEDVFFNDCDDADVLAAATLGIVNGTGEDNFSPDSLIDRRSSARMLALTCQVLGQDVENAPVADFPDYEEISRWAKVYVNYVYEQGIMTGATGGIFDPMNDYTTETSVLTFIRMFDNIDFGFDTEIIDDVPTE